MTETLSLMAAAAVADRVHLALPGDPVLVLGDRTRIRQVVRNLVCNAERYGGPKIVIETATVPGWVCLFVRDNGDGIPESDIARVFEPYGRVAGSEQRHEHSVGLGLRVALELARRMGGDLGYARHDGWTVFEFRLPAG